MKGVNKKYYTLVKLTAFAFVISVFVELGLVIGTFVCWNSNPVFRDILGIWAAVLGLGIFFGIKTLAKN
jgi:hypothetical protein